MMARWCNLRYWQATVDRSLSCAAMRLHVSYPRYCYHLSCGLAWFGLLNNRTAAFCFNGLVYNLFSRMSTAAAFQLNLVSSAVCVAKVCHWKERGKASGFWRLFSQHSKRFNLKLKLSWKKHQSQVGGRWMCEELTALQCVCCAYHFYWGLFNVQQFPEWMHASVADSWNRLQFNK